MHDENIHITTDPNEGYPRPDIPADEAWNKMSELLDAEMPASPSETSAGPEPPPSAGGGFFSGSIHLWGISLGVIGIAALLTWVVIRHGNKSETSSMTIDNIQQGQTEIAYDSSTSGNQMNATTPDVPKASGSNNDKSQKIDAPMAELASEKSTRQSAVSNSGSKIDPENDPLKTTMPVSVSSEGKLPMTEPTEQGVNVAGSIPENEPAQESSGEDLSSAYNSKSPQSLPVAPTEGTDPVTSYIKPVAIENAVSKADSTKGGVEVPAGESPWNDVSAESGPDKSKRAPGLSENNAWRIGITGNIGQVVQNGRAPNLFYGAMVTGGLWNDKLKAGIETGIGWENYYDYGSVTENIRMSDTVYMDTLPTVIHTDTTRIHSYSYRYQYIQVPLFISKQVLARGRFSLDIKTGPVVGFMFSDQRKIESTPGPDGGEILSTVDNDYSRLNISWQWHIMPHFQWDINDRFSLTLTPTAIFYLNNLYESSNRPSGVPVGISIYGGLIYKFK
jgi:hypothetical protein